MLDPAVNVVLDDAAPTEPYRLRDALMGQIKLRNLRLQDVCQLKICFRGIAYLRVPSLNRCSSSVSGPAGFERVDRIVHRQQVLCDKSELYQGIDGTLSWPFFFTFTYVDETRPHITWQNIFSKWTPFPPSMACRGSQFDCKVEYTLEAELQVALGGACIRSYTKRLEINYEPDYEPVLSHGPEPKMASLSSSFPVPTLPQPLDIQGRQPPQYMEFFDLFLNRYQRPRAEFSVDLQLPSVLIRKEPIPLRVAIKLSNAIHNPPPCFRAVGLKVCIRRNTLVLAAPHEVMFDTAEFAISSRRDLDIPLPVDWEVSLGQMMWNSALADLPPTFSYGENTVDNPIITQGYSISVGLTVKCREQEFVAWGKSTVTIEPSRPGPACGPQPGLTDNLPTLPTSDMPPSYEATVASSSKDHATLPCPPRKADATRDTGDEYGDTKLKFGPKGEFFTFMLDRCVWKDHGIAEFALKWDFWGRRRLVARNVQTMELCADHFSKSS